MRSTRPLRRFTAREAPFRNRLPRACNSIRGDQDARRPSPIWPTFACHTTATTEPCTTADRKSVVERKSVDLGGRRIIKKKKKKTKTDGRKANTINQCAVHTARGHAT